MADNIQSFIKKCADVFEAIMKNGIREYKE